MEEQSHENILVYDISHKAFIDPKPLRIRFDPIGRFIKIYDGTRYLPLFGSEEFEVFTTESDILSA